MSEPRVFRQYRFQPPPGATELLLIRHGESEAMVQGQAFELRDGWGDPPLSADGQHQAKQVGERLADEPLAALYVSSLQRTAQTAAPLAAALGMQPITVVDLREVHLGEWEAGLFRQKVAERDPIAMQMFAEQRWDVIPGAEPGADFAQRVRAAFDRIADTHPDQRVAVFAHGGTIGEMLAQITGAHGFAFVGADNASISHVVRTPERWLLRRFNDTAHLC